MTLVPPHLRMVKAIIVEPPNSVPDRRYRVFVTLNRSDRPKYMVFYCNHCQAPVAEINNVEVASLSDLIDFNANDGIIGIRCDGRFAKGRCGYWYYFSLNK